MNTTPTLFDPAPKDATFYNTIGISGDDLTLAKENTDKQDARVLKIFESGFEYTPYEVMDIYNSLYPPTEIRSIARAITNLTDAGKLERLGKEKRKMERMGKLNYCWKIKR